MKKAMIDQMIDRFLSWKLPKGFCPDAGISFKPTKPYEGDELGNSWWPVGTNLLTAEQAREMVLHMLDGVTPLTSFTTEAEADAYMSGYCERESSKTANGQDQRPERSEGRAGS